MKFSTDADFIPLSEFRSNGQNASRRINLLEANNITVARLVKQEGKISVSPLFPTTKEQENAKEVEARIQSVEISAQQKEAIIQREANQKVQAIKEENESAIRTIRQEYRDTIRKLSDKADKAERRFQLLYSHYSKVQKIRELSHNEKENNLQRTKLEKYERILLEIKKCLPEIEYIPTTPVGQSKEPDHGNGTSKSCVTPTVMTVIKNLHPFVDFIVVIILCIIVGITLPRSCATTYKSLKERLEVANDSILHLEEQLRTQQEDMNGSCNESNYDRGAPRTED